MPTTIVPGLYQHFKGGVYHVLAVSQHTESGESLVVYIDRDGKWWARPEVMFTEPGRFTLIREVRHGEISIEELLKP